MFVTMDGLWLMWFANQSKLLNSAGDGTARPEPDGTDFFFSSVSHTRFGHSYIFFLLQLRPSRISPLSFPDIHYYKLILIVLTKFVIDALLP